MKVDGNIFVVDELEDTRYWRLLTKEDVDYAIEHGRLPKCECGAAKLGAKNRGPEHSRWCPVAPVGSK